MSDQRELTADGWPLGVTREQILAELGISRELAAECARLAALSEVEFEALLAQRRSELLEQIGQGMRRGRGKSEKSLRLIEAARDILSRIQPASVRAVCYQLFNAKLTPDMSKASTNRVGTQLVWARKEGMIPWEWICRRDPGSRTGLGVGGSRELRRSSSS